MSQAGFVLNIIAVVLIVVAMLTLGRWVFGIDMLVMPEWAVQ